MRDGVYWRDRRGIAPRSRSTPSGTRLSAIWMATASPMQRRVGRSGGGRDLISLAALRNENGLPQHVATAYLGDRVRVTLDDRLAEIPSPSLATPRRIRSAVRLWRRRAVFGLGEPRS
jgi:hypothetical protein